MPALMCTTVPPAKSSAPRSNNQPEGENTQCATGEYTITDHRPRNHTHAANRIRSAIAPVMSAGVMTANIIWYAANTIGGNVNSPNHSTPAGSGGYIVATSLRPTKSKLPISDPSPPNANEYPIRPQSTLIRPSAKKFCISIASTFLLRTMPP
ncbi:MAG: hypothetical protein KatS3mg010_2129 [Acidimicrobiia bacterium]|nr:MAG: hypothetical protein KatS3mg010_0080 [Acidimicrobiia bacterium]GIU91030.1 MAG: hypothetical protein KatS3mg010_2129 [Acidimicrobiia bacterium]